MFVSGTFTMSGGSIMGNEAPSGGGVYVSSQGGNFTKTSDTVSGNFLSDNTPDEVCPAP